MLPPRSLRHMTTTTGPDVRPANGLMRGSPPPPDKLVTLANWQDPPFNRWGFLHVRDLIPTAQISRGGGPVAELEHDPHDVGSIPFRFRGDDWSVAKMLDATFTDGLLVLHGGRVVDERYVDGMEPDTTHLLMSVSKSVTATLAGALADQGRLDPAALVTEYIDELKGGVFEGCTVQHLLDMRAGTKFSEDYEDLDSDVRVYEQVCGWRPRTDPDLAADLYGYMAGLTENARPHGGPFEYRSILTDVLGWVIERAGGDRFATLCSREVWSKLGAERDAEITVDPHGCAMEDGGICTTLRDLARFGQMHLDEGLAPGGRVVSAEWVRGCTRSDPELLEAFAGAPDGKEFPGGMYHNQWWVIDPARGIHSGLGINGQQVLIHPPSRTVVAKFSTQPLAWDTELSQLQMRGSLAICDALERGAV
jgi:CubicO group peptidase (beta-lactamase class C family)